MREFICIDCANLLEGDDLRCWEELMDPSVPGSYQSFVECPDCGGGIEDLTTETAWPVLLEKIKAWPQSSMQMSAWFQIQELAQWIKEVEAG